jgi:hypothetical protein
MKSIFLFLFLFLNLGFTRILEVGSTKTYLTPSEVSSIAIDGDTILINAEEYIGDATVWYPNNLVIKGINGRPHLRANGVYVQGKGTWVIKGNNTTIENIEFSEASVPDQNGAGIRQDGGSLTIRNCYFHNNENGILGGTTGTILIEYSQFFYNGYGDGQSHNLYISNIDTLIFRYNYSHHARIGHNVKSRAKVNFIEYNRIMDENNGTSSYAIDIPNGGLTYIIGNLIQQGVDTDNSTIISYGAEGLINPISKLYFINNTVVNDRWAGTFLYVRTGSIAKIQNNIFTGPGTILNGVGNLITNLITDIPGFIDRSNFDYRLMKNSIAIDTGSNAGFGDVYSLTPTYEYQHLCEKKYRIQIGVIDIGAYEYADLPPVAPLSLTIYP